MAASDADGYIRALQLARDCITFGARISTVIHVSGLTRLQLKSFFYRKEQCIPGRPPSSCDWLHCRHMLERAEASEFANIFSCLFVQQRCAPAEALLVAYRMYSECNPDRPILTFDRAFSIVSQMLGIWKCAEANLALHTCPYCRARYLAEVGAPPPYPDGCIFCELLHRYPREPRIEAFFAGRRPRLTNLSSPGADPETSA